MGALTEKWIHSYLGFKLGLNVKKSNLGVEDEDMIHVIEAMKKNKGEKTWHTDI